MDTCFFMELIKFKEDKTGIDSVMLRKKEFGAEKDPLFLAQCAVLYENLHYFRKNRLRAINMTWGDQWSDKVRYNGKWVTQRDYIMSQGKVPLQTNQIKKMITSVTGMWSKQKYEPVAKARRKADEPFGDLMSGVAQACWQLNDMSVILESEIEECLQGGLAVVRAEYGFNSTLQKEDVWVKPINPNDIFFDSAMKDPRFWDISTVGEIHDIPFNEVCEKFAESPEDYKKLKEWYALPANPLKYRASTDTTKKNDDNRSDFYTPADDSLCRVYEIWTKERRPRYRLWDKQRGTLDYCDVGDTDKLREVDEENKLRIAEGKRLGFAEEEIPVIDKIWYTDIFWFYRFMTPSGYILKEGESQEPGRRQPYIILAVPFNNGKITSYIIDSIEQNIAINRILTIDDWIRRTGAKGVTFVPKNVIPDDMDYKTFAEQWTSIDGIVYYQPKPGGEMPKTFYGNVGTLNTAELVRMMKDLMEDGGTVSGALMGKTPYAGTSAALYAQQTQNSSTPWAPFLNRFEKLFANEVAEKVVGYIKEYYTMDRYEEIADELDLQACLADLTRVVDIEYKLSVSPGTENPAYWMTTNDWLEKFFDRGAVDAMDVLSIGAFPGSDKLLKRMNDRIAAMQQQSAQGEIGDDYEQKKNTILNNAA